MEVGYGAEFGRVELDTGERLFRPFDGVVRYKDKRKPIKCSVTAYPATPKYDFSKSRMEYFDGNEDSDSFISIDCFQPPEQFGALTMHIRNGMYPSAIRVGLIDNMPIFSSPSEARRDPPIEFGNDPDGSELIWHTAKEEHRRLAISELAFHFELMKPQRILDPDLDKFDDEDHRQPRWTETALVAERLEKRIERATKQLTTISKILVVGFAALFLILSGRWF